MHACVVIGTPSFEIEVGQKQVRLELEWSLDLELLSQFFSSCPSVGTP